MLEELSAALDRLVEIDPGALADGDTVVELHRQLARLTALTTRTVAAFESTGEFEEEGARSAASYVAYRCRLARGHGPVPGALGPGLRHLPLAERAWLAGELGEAQVGVLARARTPVTAACMARDEELSVDKAKALRFSTFAKVMAYWRLRADPEGAEADAGSAREGRRFHFSPSFEGAYFADGVFDPIAGDIVARELSRIEDELFAADWAEAKAGVGEGVRPGDLRRSPAQRRADALVEMATRSAAAPAQGRRPEPLFTVLVGYEGFAGTI